MVMVRDNDTVHQRGNANQPKADGSSRTMGGASYVA